jgi:hypothetical protein
MSSQPTPLPDKRSQPRLKVPAMYTLVRVRAAGSARYNWTGHVYDISMSGMRFELDEQLDTGQQIEVRAMLPGSNHTTFRLVGHVVRLQDDDGEAQLGPARMAMTFDRFCNSSDHRRLDGYLSDTVLRAAA